MKNSNTKYRATSVAVYRLRKESGQTSLFSDFSEKEKSIQEVNTKRVWEAVDSIQNKYGIKALTQGSSNINTRDRRYKNTGLLYSDHGNKILLLPYLGETV